MNVQNGIASRWVVVPAVMLFFAFAICSTAQVQTTTTTTSGQAQKEVTVERGEVVTVSGNNLVVKMEDGSLRDFHNIPESARVNVDGQELGIHDLKPGMKLQRTLTVTTTPQTITTVKKVTGKVFHVNPPNKVILTLEDNSNQEFTIPKNQKFNIDGEEKDAFQLKKGMKITATKVVEEPVSSVEHTRQVTGSMPPPPPAPAPDLPILVARATPMPQAAQAPEAAATPEQLPKTGSTIPLLALLGIGSLLGSLGLRVARLVSRT
jgi:LPXTG-motif cell wall-anchored protein